MREGIFSDFGDAIWDGDAAQSGAASERAITDDGDAVWNSDAAQTYTTQECSIVDFGDALRDGNAGQSAALGEGIAAYGGDAVRDGNARQMGAAEERLVSYAGDRLVGDRGGDVDRAGGVFVVVRNRDGGFVDLIREQPELLGPKRWGGRWIRVDVEGWQVISGLAGKRLTPIRKRVGNGQVPNESIEER